MITWTKTGKLGQSVAFQVTDRNGGYSSEPFSSLNIANWVGDDEQAVTKNLNAIRDASGADFKLMNPEHGLDVQEVFGDEIALKPADILVTMQPNVSLLVPSADCVSVIAAACSKKFLLAAHVGWRGAAAGIGAKIISTSQLYGIQPADLEIFLGPAICGDCYEVQLDVQQQVGKQLPKSILNRDKFIGVDLRLGLQYFFASVGAIVHNDQPCTFESTNYFSFRKDNITGRQGVLARLN